MVRSNKYYLKEMLIDFIFNDLKHLSCLNHIVFRIKTKKNIIQNINFIQTNSLNNLHNFIVKINLD